MTVTEQQTLTVNEVAKILGLSRAGTYRAIESGEIPSIKIGNRILVATQAIEDMLARAGIRPVVCADCGSRNLKLAD